MISISPDHSPKLQFAGTQLDLARLKYRQQHFRARQSPPPSRVSRLSSREPFFFLFFVSAKTFRRRRTGAISVPIRRSAIVLPDFHILMAKQEIR
jgi:hypothetical protein